MASLELESFKKLGFTENETRIYLSLIENGRSPAQLIAKRAKLPRSTVYSVLTTLEERTLVRREELRGKTYFRAGDPQSIVEHIEEQQRELQERKAAASQLAAAIRPLLRTSSQRVPKVEFAEGKPNVDRFLNSNLDVWIESILHRDRSTWGFQDHTFVDLFGRWLKTAWKAIHQDAGIAGRILSNRSDVERTLKGRIPGREVRVLGSALDFKSNIWVMGDYIVLIFTRVSPVYAFQIHEPMLAENLRLVFRFVYENGSTEI